MQVGMQVSMQAGRQTKYKLALDQNIKFFLVKFDAITLLRTWLCFRA